MTEITKMVLDGLYSTAKEAYRVKDWNKWNECTRNANIIISELGRMNGSIITFKLITKYREGRSSVEELDFIKALYNYDGRVVSTGRYYYNEEVTLLMITNKNGLITEEVLKNKRSTYKA